MTHDKQMPPSLMALTTYLLSKVGKSARGRLAEQLAQSDLRLWHMAILAALADFGPQAQRDLGERLAVDPSDVTKVVEELASAGHVKRTRDPADRRRVLVSLTPSGRTALAALTAQAEAVQNDVLAPLDAAERAQLHTLLTRVFEHSARLSIRRPEGHAPMPPIESPPPDEPARALRRAQ